MKTNKNNSGRKSGSKNKLTPEARVTLYQILEDDLNDLHKLMNSSNYDERMIHLKFFTKILAVGNDEIAEKTREVIYEGLEEHFRKMRFYLPHVPQNKKASELRQFLMLLSNEKIEEVLKGWMNSK